MNPLIQEIRRIRLFWLLVAVPVMFVAQAIAPQAHELVFVLSILAIVPLAALLSRATEAVATKTGDTIGGLLNATLGNLTELIIALTALKAGQYALVKASMAGVIVTNTLFMLGASLLLGGLKHHTQEYDPSTARMQAGMLFVATIALLVPSMLTEVNGKKIGGHGIYRNADLWLSILLIGCYALGMLFSLKTHREFFGSAHHEGDEAPWPMGLALATLAAVTVLVAMVSHLFVDSVAARGDRIRNDACLRRLHHRRAGRRCGGNGLGLLWRTQEQVGLERRHRARERIADRALRCTDARPAQLRDWAGADELAILARRDRDDADRDDDGVADRQ